MTNHEHITRLQEAQDLMREALDILKSLNDDGQFAKHVIQEIKSATEGRVGWTLDHWIHAANHPEKYGTEMLRSDTTPAVCSCGTPLDADGKCARETELDASLLVEPPTTDDDTERITPRTLFKSEWDNRVANRRRAGEA